MIVDLDSGSAPGWPLVLYFHHVSDDIDHYTAITPASFTLTMERLADEFVFLSSHAVSTVRAEPGGRPRVLLTFDDGYLSQFHQALPIMQKVDATALFFVNPTLHAPGRRERGPREPLMTWDQLREIARLGHRIGSHGRDHAPATDLGSTRWARDLASSREHIEQQIGRRPSEYAYPFGIVPGPGRTVLDHYDFAFGTVKSPACPWAAAPHQIRRVFVANDAREQARRFRRWKENP